MTFEKRCGVPCMEEHIQFQNRGNMFQLIKFLILILNVELMLILNVELILILNCGRAKSTSHNH